MSNRDGWGVFLVWNYRRFGVLLPHVTVLGLAAAAAVLWTELPWWARVPLAVCVAIAVPTLNIAAGVLCSLLADRHGFDFRWARRMLAERKLSPSEREALELWARAHQTFPDRGDNP